MNYRHSYHAGNFTEVFKHVILIGLVQHLLKKESSFCYLDTHSGTGCYDLLSEAAQKTQEFTLGIAKIYSEKNPPDFVKDYLQCVKKINPNSELQFYPGSPYFVKEMLRKQDRMILSELHPEDYQLLKNFFPHDKQVAVHHQDGYQSLKAFLPPKERRSLVLIDPSYESSDEFEKLLKWLPETIKRWETGIYAIWYPIKNRSATDRFLKSLKEKIKHPFMIAELSIFPEDTSLQLNGCGMAIINPPWQFDLKMQGVLSWLWHRLSIDNKGRFSLTSA